MEQYLQHYGVKGQKHGLRRYQNEDGSLTAEGRDHYGVGNERGGSGGARSAGRLTKSNYKVLFRKKKDSGNTENDAEAEKKAKRRNAIKKAAIGVGAAAAIAALGYGASTKLRNDMRGEAEKLSRQHRNRIGTSMDRLDTARKRAASSQEKLGKSSDSLKNQANHLRYTMDKAAVRSVQKEIRKHAEMSVKYNKVALSATRRQAVSNFFKNKGRIVI